MSLTASTLTGVAEGTFPHVDLLPEEIAQERKFRATRALLSLVVIGSVLVTGGLYFVATSQVNQATDDLASATTQQAALKAEAAKYAEVPKVYAQVAVAEQQLTQAMGQEVRYSYVLNDLSLMMSRVSGVWLQTLNVTQASDPTQAKTALGGPALGTITFGGTATQYNDVAAFLDGLAKTPYYTAPYFNNSTAGQTIGDTPVVTFSSQVSLTAKALSNRYTPKAGG